MRVTALTFEDTLEVHPEGCELEAFQFDGAIDGRAFYTYAQAPRNEKVILRPGESLQVTFVLRGIPEQD